MPERSNKPPLNKPNNCPHNILVLGVGDCVRSKRTLAQSPLKAEPSSTKNPKAIARLVVGIFFPQRPLLGLDGNAYSPGVLLQILTAAGHVKSFAQASKVIEVLAHFYISHQHIQQLTERVGTEMADKRDQATEDYVHHRRTHPTGEVPQAVTVVLDGGRVMTRETQSSRGVHNPKWKEDKVACLQTYQSQTHDQDPQVEPPPCFLDARYVDDLARDIQSTAAARQENELPQLQELGHQGPATTKPIDEPSPTKAQQGQDRETHQPQGPKRLTRVAVASMQSSAEFGKTVAAQAYLRNFFASERRAVLGDGSAWIWNIQSKWFRDFVPIVDFVHVLSYLYLTASVTNSSISQRWQQYVVWMRACWQGRVAEVIEHMQQCLDGFEPVGPEEVLAATHPRSVLSQTIGYLQNNRSRMDYPSYRRSGLPVTSSCVESLIKEFNFRVKGTEKFWNRPNGVESMLQIRAALLSEEDTLAEHIAKRPGSYFRRYEKKQTTMAA